MVVGSNVFSPTSGQPTIYDHNDEASNITHAAISDGELIIRDQDKQTQDINELSHDTENAHSKLKPIFNKEDEQTRLNIVTSLKELGEQVKELERTIHKDAGKDSKDGKMGNDFSKGVDSAVSIITGIITGDMTGGLAGASAPWLAEQIKIQAGDNETARLVAHAILGAVVAELQGNSALSGGAGAVVGEVAADIIRKQLYGKEVKDLTEAEKQTISALSQLASGLAVAAGGGNFGDASAAISSSKNAVENNYLNSDEHQTKKGLEYKERKGILTDEEKMELLELRLKDDSLSDALINACIDVNSDECHVERQKAYDALKTYKYLTYSNPPNAQIGYQEIEHLLNSTSSAADEFRAIYNGYVVSFKSFGYSDEEAQVMAGRTIAIMMMINGLEGHFALPIINRALKGSKLSTANKSKTSNITGKLDKDYFESVYGKENVQQGGGNYKETKDNINNNHAANQQANKSSNFDEHVVNEKDLGNAGKQTNRFEPTTLSELHSDLISKGFQLKGTSTGGYTTYKHPDGRIVTVKPTGEVIPTKPKIAENGKKYNERTDYEFNRLKDQSHSTGHFINRDK